jgi:hypothetical protein
MEYVFYAIMSFCGGATVALLERIAKALEERNKQTFKDK